MGVCFTDIYRWEGDEGVYQTLLFKSEKDRKRYEDLCASKTDNWGTVKDALEAIDDWDYQGVENSSGAIYKFRAVKTPDGDWEAIVRNGKHGGLCVEAPNRFSTPEEAIDFLKTYPVFSINELM